MGLGEVHKSDRPRTPVALAIFRHYVSDFVNRHDFTALPAIMQPDYTLITSGLEVAGRDGPYRSAVSRQMDQFPGLQFTVHKLFVSGDKIGIHFTEHGASSLHDGARAAWPSIAIYEARDGLLARCTIEQDYFSRRWQLNEKTPLPVPSPAIAPWDEQDMKPDASAEVAVTQWLKKGDWLVDGSVGVDDSDATGTIEAVLSNDVIDVGLMMSGLAPDGAIHVAFHAKQNGLVDRRFGEAFDGRPAVYEQLYLSGLVTLRDSNVVAGNIIRDRWSLFRRLAKANEHAAAKPLPF